MKKLLSLALATCLLFNSAVPAFSAGSGSNRRRSSAQGSCNVNAMLSSSLDGQWLRVNCLREATSHFQRNGKAKGNQLTVCTNAATRIVTHTQNLLVQGKRSEGVAFEKSLRNFNRASGVQGGTLCVDMSGKRVPCKNTSNNVHDQITNQMNGGGANNPPANGTESDDTDTEISGGHDFDFCFGVGEGTPNPELENRIRQLARFDKNQLSSAIDVLVAAGSGDPSDPEYVHPLILKAAFFLYAQKITAAEQKNIERYLNPQGIYSGIDSAHASSVSLAAASALFAFAKQNPEAIEAKFPLSSSYGTVQNTLSASDVMVGAIAIAYAPSFWKAVAAEMAAMGGEVTGSAAAFAASVKTAMATAAKTGVAVVSSAEMGITLLFVGGLVCFIYALNDAYSPGYKAAFQRAKAKFWNEVLSQPENPGVDDSILRVIPADWSPYFAKYGSAEATAANTATCTPKQPQEQCEKITMKQVKSYFSSPESPLPVGELNAHLRRLFDKDFTKSTTIGELLPRFPVGDSVGELFKFIAQNCDSFKNSKGGTAFPKPVKQGSSFVRELEIGVNIGNIPLTQVLAESIISTLCRGNAYLNERIDLGGGRWIRNTEHERNGDHFHYGEGECNHSINFTGGSFIDKMREICAARR